VARRAAAAPAGVRTAASYAVAVALVFATWQVASDLFDVPVLFPSPLAAARKGVALVAEGRLQQDVAVSLWRILTGFAIGSVLGTALGLLMGSSRLVADLLAPYVNFLRFIASIAWISAVMVWFGIGETAKIVLIVYTTTFVVLLNTMAGVVSVHPNKIRAARCFGASPRQIFVSVTLPATLGYILTGMRLAMMNSFMTVVSAEMIAAEAGVGFLIFNSRQWMETDAIFVGMFTLGVLGLLTDRVMQALIARFLWRFRTPA
jgi:NitT/TauT family transport system permease protein